MTRAKRAAIRTKGAAKSKLMWLGLAVLVMGEVQRNADVLAAFIPHEWMGIFTSALGLGIMVARFFTTESLEEKGETTDENENA